MRGAWFGLRSCIQYTIILTQVKLRLAERSKADPRSAGPVVYKMPKIAVHKEGQVYAGEVKEDTNLVVRAGIKQFPWPHLKYRCGMGQCGTCTSHILRGAEHLPEPNWKEQKILGERLKLGYRLCCQLWIKHDLELTQENLVPPSPPTSS